MQPFLSLFLGQCEHFGEDGQCVDGCGLTECTQRRLRDNTSRTRSRSPILPPFRRVKHWEYTSTAHTRSRTLRNICVSCCSLNDLLLLQFHLKGLLLITLPPYHRPISSHRHVAMMSKWKMENTSSTTRFFEWDSETFFFFPNPKRHLFWTYPINFFTVILTGLNCKSRLIGTIDLRNIQSYTESIQF